MKRFLLLGLWLCLFLGSYAQPGNIKTRFHFTLKEYPLSETGSNKKAATNLPVVSYKVFIGNTFEGAETSASINMVFDKDTLYRCYEVVALNPHRSFDKVIFSFKDSQRASTTTIEVNISEQRTSTCFLGEISLLKPRYTFDGNKPLYWDKYGRKILDPEQSLEESRLFEVYPYPTPTSVSTKKKPKERVKKRKLQQTPQPKKAIVKAPIVRPDFYVYYSQGKGKKRKKKDALVIFNGDTLALVTDPSEEISGYAFTKKPPYGYPFDLSVQHPMYPEYSFNQKNPDYYSAYLSFPEEPLFYSQGSLWPLQWNGRTISVKIHTPGRLNGLSKNDLDSMKKAANQSIENICRWFGLKAVPGIAEKSSPADLWRVRNQLAPFVFLLEKLDGTTIAPAGEDWIARLRALPSVQFVGLPLNMQSNGHHMTNAFSVRFNRKTSKARIQEIFETCGLSNFNFVHGDGTGGNGYAAYVCTPDNSLLIPQMDVLQRLMSFEEVWRINNHMVDFTDMFMD